MDAVTEVLIDRRHQADRLSQMMVVSLLAHALLIAAVSIAPRLWPERAEIDASHVMTISLAGGEGPIQGRNPQAAKPVQEAVPDIVKPKNEAPPMLTKPEMIEPLKVPKPEPKATPKTEPRKTEPQLHGRTPTQGAQERQGTARRDTGQTAAIPFGGLATGGGPVGGAYTDYADFCCPEYLQTMTRSIYGNW